MRIVIFHLLLSLPLATAGCGKGSEAAPKAAARPSPAARSGPPTVESPLPDPARSMPGAEDQSSPVELKVESVEADLFAPPAIAGTPVSILLKVTSRQDRPRLRVEARRFYIEADGSVKTQARPGSSKEPQLPTAYLKAGESVSGWLTFEVPKGAKQLILKSDMRRPPLEVPIALPGRPPGG